MAWGVRSVRNLISTQAYTGHFLTRAERGGTSCDAVWIGTACVLTDRDDERYGADLDGVCVNGYESTICERNGRWYGTN